MNTYQRKKPKTLRTYQRKKPKTLRTYEVCGQCDRCKDFFSVDVFLLHRQLEVVLTNRLSLTWVSHGETTGEEMIVHRVGVCNGKVHLYGHIPQEHEHTRAATTEKDARDRLS